MRQAPPGGTVPGFRAFLLFASLAALTLEARAAPLSGPAENPAPDKGPPTDAPATAGFG